MQYLSLLTFEHPLKQIRVCEETHFVGVSKGGSANVCIALNRTHSLRLKRSHCKAKYVSCEHGCCFFYRGEVIRFNIVPSSLSNTTSWKIGIARTQGPPQTLSSAISVTRPPPYNSTGLAYLNVCVPPNLGRCNLNEINISAEWNFSIDWRHYREKI